MTEYLNIKICKTSGEVIYSGLITADAVILGEEFNSPRTARIEVPLVDFTSRLEEAVQSNTEEVG